MKTNFDSLNEKHIKDEYKPTPEMIAVGWAVLDKPKGRGRPLLGPGAGLKEAFAAMTAVALEQKEKEG